MRFLPHRRAFLAQAGAGLTLATPARAQNSPAAQRIIDRARAASGGAGWNSLRGLHEIGQEDGARYERWTDPVRYGDRFEVETPRGLFVQGYNGAYEWRILANGAVTGSTDAVMNRKIRTEAFFAAYAYFFPSRFDLRTSLLGVRQAGGDSFDVLRMQPAGGFPRELWFDRASGLLGQMVDENGGKRITTEFSDYRRVGAVRIPHLAVTTGGDLPTPKRRKLERIDFPPADRTLFTLSPERVHRGQPQPEALPRKGAG